MPKITLTDAQINEIKGMDLPKGVFPSDAEVKEDERFTAQLKRYIRVHFHKYPVIVDLKAAATNGLDAWMRKGVQRLSQDKANGLEVEIVEKFRRFFRHLGQIVAGKISDPRRGAVLMSELQAAIAKIVSLNPKAILSAEQLDAWTSKVRDQVPIVREIEKGETESHQAVIAKAKEYMAFMQSMGASLSAVPDMPDEDTADVSDDEDEK